MMKNEFLQLLTVKEMWKVIVENLELRQDAEIFRAFNEKRADEGRKNVIEAFGNLAPAVHYDWNRKSK